MIGKRSGFIFFIILGILLMPMSRISWCEEKKKKKEDKKVMGKQKALMEKYKKLEEVIFRVADLVKETDPDTAARLKLAFKHAKKTFIYKHMDEILKLLKKESFAEALKKQKDVTELLRRHVRGLPLIALPSPKYNAAFGGDPAPGIVKQLKIQYRMDGKEGEATFGEDAAIMLPVPK